MQRILTLLMLTGGTLLAGCIQTAGRPEAQPADMRLAAEEMSLGRGGSRAYAMAEAPAPAEAEPQEVPHLTAVQPRKVIYTGAFRVVVPDVEHALAATKDLSEQMDGYMQQMTSARIVIRVPAEKFNQAVDELGKLGTVVDKNIAARDVTEQYVDLEIRLDNAKVLREKLIALLDRAKTVKEALEVERELARVRTEIERLEGQLNSLSSQIAYATITVHFSPTEQAPEELKVRLPFWWLYELGLNNLVRF